MCVWGASSEGKVSLCFAHNNYCYWYCWWWCSHNKGCDTFRVPETLVVETFQWEINDELPIIAQSSLHYQPLPLHNLPGWFPCGVAQSLSWVLSTLACVSRDALWLGIPIINWIRAPMGSWGKEGEGRKWTEKIKFWWQCCPIDLFFAASFPLHPSPTGGFAFGNGDGGKYDLVALISDSNLRVSACV